VPSAHAVGAVQSYDWEQEPVLISAGCLARVREGTAEDLRALRWMADDRVWPILVHDAVERLPAMRPPSADIGTWRLELPVVVAHTATPDVQVGDRAALGAAFGIDLEPGRFAGALVVLGKRNDGCSVPLHNRRRRVSEKTDRPSEPIRRPLRPPPRGE